MMPLLFYYPYIRIGKGDNKMKRVLTIQDISCFGKCSITVALPVISAMGVETVILPTALLSAHTQFSGFTFKDLSDQLFPIIENWKKHNIKFDAIYTGYLGSEEEIETVKYIINEFRDENTIVFVDPAMGDNGVLYPLFDENYAHKNGELCSIADIIVPNLTEACYMMDIKYREKYDEEYLKEVLKKLSDNGSTIAVLTGVSLKEGKTGVMGYDKSREEFYIFQTDRVPKSSHGTGDLFSSAAVGAMMNGIDWKDAMRLAALYTAKTIEVTMNNPQDHWYGVDFETTIPYLLELIRKEQNIQK